MPRTVVVVVTLAAVVAYAYTVGAGPAAACDCAAVGPPSVVFDGTTTGVAPAEFGELWTFDVDEVHEGEAGDEAAVVIASGDSAGCGIALEPEVGAQYRVGVLPPEDGGPFHVNLCTGSLELLGAASADEELPDRSSDGDGASTAVLAIGGLAGATVVGLAAAAVVSTRRSSTGS